MPGGDRTGPFGAGPKTGRGLGYCSGNNAPGWTYGRGMGLGRGLGRGWGRGFGRGFWGRGRCWWYPYPYPYGGAPVQVDEQTEKNTLQSEAEFLKSRLQEIEKRLSELG